ncbi:MAG: SurA N-terminal domain-containing protein [Xanthomonadaceae bacterium]|nr:SurA N-terminal domain-containing protein [Xanthomonadaceae bacterium]
MIRAMRDKLGPWVVGTIMGAIALVFVFYGVYNPKYSGPTATSAGAVNGEPISVSEFSKELNRKTQQFQQMFGGKVDLAQMKMFNLRQMVFNEIVSRKLMVQQAEKMGLIPSPEQIRDTISKMTAFQKEGQFDKLTYRKVLESNNLAPSQFETMVKQDFMAQMVRDYFAGTINVSDADTKQDYLDQNEKRSVKFVLLNQATGGATLKFETKDFETFFKDPAKAQLAKNRFDDGVKSAEYKDKKFDDVKNEIARDILSAEHSEKIRKNNETFANELIAKFGDAALIKRAGAKLETSQLQPKSTFSIPGFGENAELTEAAFNGKLSKPMKFVSPLGVVVAQVKEAKNVDFSKVKPEDLAKSKRELLSKKQNQVFQEWMSQVRNKAKIEVNQNLIQGENS